MNLRFLGRASGRLLVIAGMTIGVTGAAATIASAQVRPAVNGWYVSATGNDTGNNCTAASAPCATITHALIEQAASSTTGTIHVGAGVFQEQLVTTTGNDGVTIKGAGSGSTTIDAPSSLAADSDTDSAEPQLAIVDVTPGTTGFNLQKLTVSGVSGESGLDADGDACNQDYLGVYYHASSGGLSKVDVTGIDMPQDLFGCQGGQGIYVTSTDTDSANVTISDVDETAPVSTTTTKAALPADTYDGNDILPVKSVPASFVNGQGIVVNGYNLTATEDTPKSLYITGTTSSVSPKGSVVNYLPYQPAFDKTGIVCDDNWTTCTITGSVIDGEGPTNSIGQNGIQGFGAASITIGGASASLGNTITGFSYSGTSATAAGVLLFNNGPTLVENNNVSSSDINIYAGNVAAFGDEPASNGSWSIEDNNVSDALCSGQNVTDSNGIPGCSSGWGEGIELDSTNFNVAVTGNHVSGSAQAGILVSGVQNATIGEAGAGNVVTGNGTDLGMLMDGPGSECEVAYQSNCIPEPGNADQFTSTGNTVVDNSFSTNGIGVIADGGYGPNAFGGSDPEGTYANDFGGNTWSGNIAAGIADFTAFGSTPPSNTYGPTAGSADNSCDPSENGSSTLDSYGGGSGYWGC